MLQPAKIAKPSPANSTLDFMVTRSTEDVFYLLKKTLVHRMTRCDADRPKLLEEISLFAGQLGGNFNYHSDELVAPTIRTQAS